MKKISKSIGAETNEGNEKKNYFEIYRNTPAEKKKNFSLAELVQEVKQARAERLKKAS